MKTRVIKWCTRGAAVVTFGLFVYGVMWCIFPINKATLPHLIEQDLHISFKWAALLISFFLGLLAVSSFSLYAAVDAIEVRQE